MLLNDVAVTRMAVSQDEMHLSARQRDGGQVGEGRGRLGRRTRARTAPSREGITLRPTLLVIRGHTYPQPQSQQGQT